MLRHESKGLELIVFGLISLPLLAAENKANFSGVWILDTASSNLGDIGTPKHLVMSVEHHGNSLTVVEISRGDHGKAVSKWDYALDVSKSSSGKTLHLHNATRHEKWMLLKGSSVLLMERRDGCDGLLELIFKRSTGVTETQ